MGFELLPSLDSPQWKILYTAALFENDVAMRPVRIRTAERALVLRARELFRLEGVHIEEKHAIDEAMFALHTLADPIRRPMMKQITRDLGSQFSQNAELVRHPRSA